MMQRKRFILQFSYVNVIGRAQFDVGGGYGEEEEEGDEADKLSPIVIFICSDILQGKLVKE